MLTELETDRIWGMPEPPFFRTDVHAPWREKRPKGRPEWWRPSEHAIGRLLRFAYPDMPVLLGEDAALHTRLMNRKHPRYSPGTNYWLTRMDMPVVRTSIFRRNGLFVREAQRIGRGISTWDDCHRNDPEAAGIDLWIGPPDPINRALRRQNVLRAVFAAWPGIEPAWLLPYRGAGPILFVHVRRNSPAAKLMASRNITARLT